ncbi:MAG: carbon-nitrogen hydrolase [Planctomycetes bacterium]|nr:carbon-nitrogen hydrolase [Planctomycetota bacterium]
MDCQLHLAQLEPTLGNLDANLAMHVETAERAVEEGVDLLLFSELSLTGYFLKDQTPEVALKRGEGPLARIAELSKDVSIAAGFVERAADGQLYNAYGFWEDGELVGLHRKVHLVTYGMFEEHRDMGAGCEFATIESRHGRFAVLTCEDAWHMQGPMLAFHSGVDALLVPSASPARGVQANGAGLGSVQAWERLLSTWALLTQTWVCHINRVGFEDGIGFGGGTRVIDPFGESTAALEGLDAGTLSARMDSAALDRARVALPLRRDDRAWILARELAQRAEAGGWEGRAE